MKKSQKRAKPKRTLLSLQVPNKASDTVDSVSKYFLQLSAMEPESPKSGLDEGEKVTRTTKLGYVFRNE
jgi:hypothetical protein